MIENTINNPSFLGKDVLLAGGLLGSFAYLSFCVPEKVIVVRPKEKHSHHKSREHNKTHHTASSIDRLASDPNQKCDSEVNSRVVKTEHGEDDHTFQFYSQKSFHGKSHTHLPQTKAQKVTFDEDTLSSIDSKERTKPYSGNLQGGSVSQTNSPKKNLSWFMEHSKRAQSKANHGESQLPKSSFSTNENSKLLDIKTDGCEGKNSAPHSPILVLTKNSSVNSNTNDSLNNSHNSLETPHEKKSCFQGLTRFKTAMASRNPFFLSGMGFSALSMRDSASMFETARIKVTKSMKETPPKTLFHLPIEKPLLSKEDVSFIQRMMNQRNEEHFKILNSRNEKETVMRKAMDIHVEGQEWEVSEYNAKEFNLDNVYKNFLIEQKPKAILQISNEPMEVKEKKELLTEVSERENEDTTTAGLKRKKYKGIKALTAKETELDRKYSNFSSASEDIDQFLKSSLYERPDNVLESGLEDEMLRIHEIMRNCRKFNEIQSQNLGILEQEETQLPEVDPTVKISSSIVENVKLNVCIKSSENPEIDTFCVGKISFTLSQTGMFLLANKPLCIDFSGKRLVQTIMNHQMKPSQFNIIWQSNKLVVPNDCLILGENTLTFLTATDPKAIKNPLLVSDFSTLMPCFKDFDKPMDVHFTWIYPKSMTLISSLSENFERDLNEFEIDADLNLENFLLKKIRSPHALKNHGFLFGDLDVILNNDAFVFYCKRGEKKQFVKKSMALSDILRLAEAFFNNYFKLLDPLKSSLKFVFVDTQKAALKVFHGLVLLKSAYMFKEDKFPELLYILLKLLLKEIFLSNDIFLKPEYTWMFHGLSGFLIMHFLEKPISTNFEIPRNEILTLIIQGKAAAIEQSLLKGGPHKLNDSSLDKLQTDDAISIYKSIYFFKQLASYIGKKAIHQVLMDLDYRNFSIKLFLSSLEPFLRENELVYFKKWLGVWLCGFGMQEIEFEILCNPHRPLFLNELLIKQRPLNWVQGGNELNYHFLAFSLVNNAGVSQFTLDIVIPNTSESLIADKIKGKYVPKALILDPDDNGFFIPRFDPKSRVFLFRNIHKIHEFKMRANCYCAFYIDTLLGRVNMLDFFEIALRGMETEPDFYILKFLHKSCKLIYRTQPTEEIRARMFKAFVDFLQRRKFERQDGFFLKNAVFYCRTCLEFELLEKTLENISKPNGLLIPMLPLILKMLWKKRLFYSIFAKSVGENEDFEHKNQSFLQKICLDLEPELAKDTFGLYKCQIMGETVKPTIRDFYEKLKSMLLDLESFRSNPLEFQCFVLSSQILEEYSLLNAQEEEKQVIETSDFVEYLRKNEENDDFELIRTAIFMVNFVGRDEVLPKIEGKGRLGRYLRNKAEIAELLKNSLGVARILTD